MLLLLQLQSVLCCAVLCCDMREQEGNNSVNVFPELFWPWYRLYDMVFIKATGEQVNDPPAVVGGERRSRSVGRVRSDFYFTGQLERMFRFLGVKDVEFTPNWHLLLETCLGIRNK